MTGVERARAAGRRLAAYWKTQLYGAESIHESMSAHWFQTIGNALGVVREKPILSRLGKAVGTLRDTPRLSDIVRCIEALKAERDHYKSELDNVWHAHVLAGFVTEEDIKRCRCELCRKICRNMEEAGFLDQGAEQRLWSPTDPD